MGIRRRRMDSGNKVSANIYDTFRVVLQLIKYIMRLCGISTNSMYFTTTGSICVVLLMVAKQGLLTLGWKLKPPNSHT